MTRRVVRVAAGQGFWGDWPEAPVRQVRGGPIDYLMMDYLAEVTMSIMQKQKSRDPKAGYARDFVPLMERILPDIVQKGIKVTSNAGGVNPRGCAEAVLEVVGGDVQRLRDLGHVAGADDILLRRDLDGRPEGQRQARQQEQDHQVRNEQVLPYPAPARPGAGIGHCAWPPGVDEPEPVRISLPDRSVCSQAVSN